MITHWMWRKSAGQTSFRARPDRPRPAGTLALPGDAAALRMYVAPDDEICCIHDPHRGTLSAVVPVSHPAYVLLSPDDAASAGVDVGSAARLTVAVRGRRGSAGARGDDPRQRARHRRVLHRASRAPERLGRAPVRGAAGHDGARGLDPSHDADADAGHAEGRSCGERPPVAGCEARQGRCATTWPRSSTCSGPRTCGSAAGLGERELAHIVRTTYDPALTDFEQGSPGANLEHAGPLGLDEMWDRLHHDTGWSRVLWISEWPRIEVPAHFLHSLVFAPGIRKSAVPVTATEGHRDGLAGDPAAEEPRDLGR